MLQTTGAATGDDGHPMQCDEEGNDTWVRPPLVLTDDDMGVEQLEQGQAKWENFTEYYSLFHDDPSLMNTLAREVGNGRPAPAAGDPLTARCPRGVCCL